MASGVISGVVMRKEAVEHLVNPASHHWLIVFDWQVVNPEVFPNVLESNSHHRLVGVHWKERSGNGVEPKRVVEFLCEFNEEVDYEQLDFWVDPGCRAHFHRVRPSDVDVDYVSDFYRYEYTKPGAHGIRIKEKIEYQGSFTTISEFEKASDYQVDFP